MKKKLIIGISIAIVVIVGIVLAVVFMPKKNEPVVNEEVKEDIVENKEVVKVSMSDEEKYDYILKVNGQKSLDDCLIEKMDIDFDGVDEFVYYPDKTLVYLGTMKIYGGEDFKEVVDLEECMGLYKIELLEDNNTKEKICVLYELALDGICNHYDRVSKLVKNEHGFTLQELFLNQCDDEQEAIVNANIEDDLDRKCVSEYLVNGKKVSENEYNKAKKKFEEKYKVIKNFEVVSDSYEYIGEFSDGMVVVQENGKVGFRNERGDLAIPCIYDAFDEEEVVFGTSSCFNEGLVPVKKDEKWGYINKKGKEVIPFIYDSASLFDNGLAKVSKNGKYGVIDKNGKEIFECKYEWVQVESSLMLVDGVIYNKNKEKLLSEIAVIEKERDGLLAVRNNDYKWGFIDTDGKLVIDMLYGDGHDYDPGRMGPRFSEGVVCVMRDEKWGYIDKTGKEKIPFIYESAFDFNNGIAQVWKDGEKIYIDKMGKDISNIIDKVKYESIVKDGLLNKIKYVDKEGKEVIYIDDVKEIRENELYIVSRNGKYGISDINGKEIIACIYENCIW